MEDSTREMWTGRYRSMLDIIEGFYKLSEGFLERKTIFKVMEMIRDLPDADVVERKRGKWIVWFSELYPADSTQECSVCHAEQFIGGDDNFCPNCGADMRGNDE